MTIPNFDPSPPPEFDAEAHCWVCDKRMPFKASRPKGEEFTFAEIILDMRRQGILMVPDQGRERALVFCGEWCLNQAKTPGGKFLANPPKGKKGRRLVPPKEGA